MESSVLITANLMIPPRYIPQDIINNNMVKALALKDLSSFSSIGKILNPGNSIRAVDTDSISKVIGTKAKVKGPLSYAAYTSTDRKLCPYTHYLPRIP